MVPPPAFLLLSFTLSPTTDSWIYDVEDILPQNHLPLLPMTPFGGATANGFAVVGQCMADGTSTDGEYKGDSKHTHLFQFDAFIAAN